MSCSAGMDDSQERVGEDIVEVVHICPTKRMQRRIVEHVVDFPVRQAVEEISDVAQFILLESITKGIIEHHVDVPTPIGILKSTSRW